MTDVQYHPTPAIREIAPAEAAPEPRGLDHDALRVTFLTHYYPPEVGAPQARISALARGLRERGLDVTVHTGFPNYPAGRVQPPYRNRPIMREEDRHGVRIVRSAVLPAANKGFLPRIANHTAFATSAMLAASATGKQDVVVVETPPLFTAGAAVPYARAKGVPLIAHVSDLWPSSAVELGALGSKHAIAAAERLERWIYRSATAITVPTRGMVETLGELADSAGKVRRMPPIVELGRFPQTSFPPLDGPLRVLYAGTIGLAQGIENLIDAAAIAGPDVVEVTLAGWGAEGDTAYKHILDRGVKNVHMTGTVPPEHVVDLYERSHVGAVLLKDKPLFAGALPTKLFECMAAGRPVVLSARGESAETVASANAGVVVGPEDGEALAATFRELHATDGHVLAAMGASGRAHVERWASLESNVTRWQSLLEATCSERVASAG